MSEAGDYVTGRQARAGLVGHLPKFIAAVDATVKATVDIVAFAMGTDSDDGEDDAEGVAWVFHEHAETGTLGAVEMRTWDIGSQRAHCGLHSCHRLPVGRPPHGSQVGFTLAYRCSSDADCRLHCCNNKPWPYTRPLPGPSPDEFFNVRLQRLEGMEQE